MDFVAVPSVGIKRVVCMFVDLSGIMIISLGKMKLQVFSFSSFCDFVARALSVIACLLDLLVSLVDYVL